MSKLKKIALQVRISEGMCDKFSRCYLQCHFKLRVWWSSLRTGERVLAEVLEREGEAEDKGRRSRQGPKENRPGLLTDNPALCILPFNIFVVCTPCAVLE